MVNEFELLMPIDIDECVYDTDDCDRVSTQCVNNNGSYTCTCRSGYSPIVGSTTLCLGWTYCIMSGLLKSLLSSQILMSVPLVLMNVIQYQQYYVSTMMVDMYVNVIVDINLYLSQQLIVLVSLNLIVKSYCSVALSS